MSDNKLPPENQRLLEMLLKPGMREYMRESARKAFDIPKLKKWLEDRAPYEEEEEALVYREYKEREARKNDGSAGEVGEGSVGKRANGTAHRTYPTTNLKPGRQARLMLPPTINTLEQHIKTINIHQEII
ncbi:hypothetical protein C1646_759082 [Rhizophagus diaphanus]|nr:hypothetical protein C1646_759082 [Rhizophagus diaphanus] [Rhizophagus sp. MUCL 43196]